MSDTTTTITVDAELNGDPDEGKRILLDLFQKSMTDIYVLGVRHGTEVGERIGVSRGFNAGVVLGLIGMGMIWACKALLFP